MAILGMLTVEPMSGYDMKQFSDLSLAYFWHESFGNLYPRLKRLSDAGLIRGRRTPRPRGPDAIIYTLTAKGRKRLRQWLQEPPEGERIRSEFMLKIFFGAQAGVSVSKERIEEYEAGQMRLCGTYKTIERSLRAALADRKDAAFWLMSLRRGQLLTEARLRWCRECRAVLDDMDDMDDNREDNGND